VGNSPHRGDYDRIAMFVGDRFVSAQVSAPGDLATVHGQVAA
jgi:hypothetical protein